MKRFILPALLFMAAPAVVSAQDDVKVATQPYENYIQVTGKAEREVTPDEIYVRIALDENSPTKKMAIDKQEAEMKKALKSAGVDVDKDLTLMGMEGGYKTYVLKKNQGTVVKHYQLKVGSAAALSDVYAKLDAINISDVRVLRVYHSRMKELGNELKVEAVKDAQAQASVLAEAVGQKAGRAVMIAEYGYMGIQGAEMAPVMLRSKAMADNAAGDGGAAEADIEFRKLKLTYSVQVKFVLD